MKLVKVETHTELGRNTEYVPESYLNIGAGRTMTIADNDYNLILSKMKKIGQFSLGGFPQYRG